MHLPLSRPIARIRPRLDRGIRRASSRDAERVAWPPGGATLRGFHLKKKKQIQIFETEDLITIFFFF